MLKRLPIVAATACIVSVTASAESIAFPRDPSPASHAYTLVAPSRSYARSQAIPGDLGKTFVNCERLLPTVPGSDVRGNGASVATPAHSLNGGLILTYYGSGPSIFVRQPSLLYPILRSLFLHMPHANSRRKQP
jgi:hypothetical protein